MNNDSTSEHSPFPLQLSDEAAFEISEMLHWLALQFDEQYFVQIRRYTDDLYRQHDRDPMQPWRKTSQSD